MEGEKLSSIAFLFAAVAGVGLIAGEGQVPPGERHLCPPNSWAAVQNVSGWNSAFQLQQGRSCWALKSRISCWKLSNELFHYEK